MAIIIFAIPLFSMTLDLNNLLKEKKEVYEVSKMAVLDARLNDEETDKEKIRRLVEENLREELPKKSYTCKVIYYNGKDDFSLKVTGKRVCVSMKSTSL